MDEAGRRAMHTRLFKVYICGRPGLLQAILLRDEGNILGMRSRCAAAGSGMARGDV